jgi:hypothetical protein
VTGPTSCRFGQTSASPYYRDNGAGGSYLAGYNYGAVMDLALCHGPVDQVLTLLIDDLDVGWTNDGDDATHSLSYFSADNPNLFGGANGGGGFRGSMLAYWARWRQQIDALHAAVLQRRLPRSRRPLPRRVHDELGALAVPAPVSVVVQRCPNSLGLTSNTHKNRDHGGLEDRPGREPGGHALRILADTTSGLGIDPSQVDLTAASGPWGQRFGPRASGSRCSSSRPAPPPT